MNTWHILPPGKYFIGDPSFVLDDELGTVLLVTDFFNRPSPVTIQGYRLWGMCCNTNVKIFTDQNGIEYQVNGVLAAVPIELIENPEGEEHGTVLDAPDGLTVMLEQGIFHFNDIMIDTNDPSNMHNQVHIDCGYDLDPDQDKFI